MTKHFPFEFEATKEIQFYPANPALTSLDILEIGPGRGDLLMTMAQNEPHKRFAAIEIGKKRFYRLIPRLEKKGIANVSLIRGDARVVIPQFFSENMFEKIFVLYPDPWPKDRHAFKRLLNKEMLSLLCHHLKPEGELIFATDVKDYAAWVIENISDIPDFKRLEVTPGSSFPLLKSKLTFFENKCFSEGKEMNYLW